MDLTNHFDIDVEALFLEWFEGEYATDFAERFPGKSIALVILDPDNMLKVLLEWETPLENAILVAHLGDEEACTKPDGLLQNVEGKLRYVLRNGISPSLEAEGDGAFFRPGDFPWEGAGERHDLIGGISGLAKEDDWAEYGKCSAKLMELLEAVGNVALKKTEELRASDNPPLGARYGKGVVVNIDDVRAELANLQAAA